MKRRLIQEEYKIYSGNWGFWDVVGSRTGGFGGLTQPWSKVSLPLVQLPTPPSSSQAPLVSTQREGRPCSLIRSFIIQDEESG